MSTNSSQTDSPRTGPAHAASPHRPNERHRYHPIEPRAGELAAVVSVAKSSPAEKLAPNPYATTASTVASVEAIAMNELALLTRAPAKTFPFLSLPAEIINIILFDCSLPSTSHLTLPLVCSSLHAFYSEEISKNVYKKIYNSHIADYWLNGIPLYIFPISLIESEHAREDALSEDDKKKVRGPFIDYKHRFHIAMQASCYLCHSWPVQPLPWKPIIESPPSKLICQSCLETYYPTIPTKEAKIRHGITDAQLRTLPSIQSKAGFSGRFEGTWVKGQCYLENDVVELMRSVNLHDKMLERW